MQQVILATALLVALSPCLPAHSQAYPAKPIRVIVTVAGGGETSARIVAEKLARQLGVPITVESQSGAGGAVAAQTVARAAPDGYTLLYANSGLALRPFLVKDVPCRLSRSPSCSTTRGAIPARFRTGRPASVRRSIFPKCRYRQSRP